MSCDEHLSELIVHTRFNVEKLSELAPIREVNNSLSNFLPTSRIQKQKLRIGYGY